MICGLSYFLFKYMVTSAAGDSYPPAAFGSPEDLFACRTFEILVVLAVPAHI